MPAELKICGHYYFFTESAIWADLCVDNVITMFYNVITERSDINGKNS